MSEEHRDLADPSSAPPPPPIPPVDPIQLPYGHVQQRPKPTGMQTLGRIALGFVGYSVISVAWFTALKHAWPQSNLAFEGWFFLTLALLGLALYLRLRYRIAGYGYGILIALFTGMAILVGVMLLIIGTCFYKK